MASIRNREPGNGPLHVGMVLVLLSAMTLMAAVPEVVLRVLRQTIKWWLS